LGLVQTQAQARHEREWGQAWLCVPLGARKHACTEVKRASGMRAAQADVGGSNVPSGLQDSVLSLLPTSLAAFLSCIAHITGITSLA